VEVEALRRDEVRAYLVAQAGGEVWKDVLADGATGVLAAAMHRPLTVGLAASRTDRMHSGGEASRSRNRPNSTGFRSPVRRTSRGT
jgi:hypothetical protein